MNEKDKQKLNEYLKNSANDRDEDMDLFMPTIIMMFCGVLILSAIVYAIW